MACRPKATRNKTLSHIQTNSRESRGSAGKAKSAYAILLAAIDEFSERGFDGARMEAIAERAGYNKSLVYRHFTDKKGLFEAVLRHKMEQRTDLARRAPDELASILEFWFQQSLRDPDYLRLLTREALNDTGDEIVEEAPRRAYYREHTEVIATLKEAGQLSGEYDPACVTLAMTALNLFPAVFPQLTRMITGHAIDARTFKRNWKRLLAQLADDLKKSGSRSRSSS